MDGQRGEGLPELTELLHAEARAEMRERGSKGQQHVAREIGADIRAGPGAISSQLEKD